MKFKFLYFKRFFKRVIIFSVLLTRKFSDYWESRQKNGRQYVFFSCLHFETRRRQKMKAEINIFQIRSTN